jgi:hypothetical protein
VRRGVEIGDGVEDRLEVLFDVAPGIRLRQDRDAQATAAKLVLKRLNMNRSGRLGCHYTKCSAV